MPKTKKIVRKGTMERAVTILKKHPGSYYSAGELAEMLGLDSRKLSMPFNAHFARALQHSHDGGFWVRYRGKPLMRTKCECGNSWMYVIPKMKVG